MELIPAKKQKLDHDTDSGFEDSAGTEGAQWAVKGNESKHKPVQKEGGGDMYACSAYKSSMFKLQVDELLEEVKPNYNKRLSAIDDALRKLKCLIEGFEDREPLSIPDATKSLNKLRKTSIPYPEPKPDQAAAYKLSYAKPANINVVGSYPLKTMVKSDTVLEIDMVVTMPGSIFQEKDYLNYRYFYKRAYYLACIAAGLQESVSKDYALNYEYKNGNSLHPILVVKSKLLSSLPNIHILLAAPAALFPESKLRPTKNSIRARETSTDGVLVQTPTPFYNASISSDTNIESYLKLIYSASKQAAGFTDACILGRIWLQQRGFAGSVTSGGFGHFEWAALTALLLKGGGTKGHAVLSPGYSSYQMFKAIVQFLSATDLATKPLVYQADLIGTKSDSPMVYDGHRGQNILYKMTPWSYSYLRYEAKTTLDMLSHTTFDHFEAAFIIKTDQPFLRYDCIIHLPTSPVTHHMNPCDHISTTRKASLGLFRVLQEGLMDRVRLINIHESSLQSWPLSVSSPAGQENSSIQIAAIFDPANIDRLVDHGPPAEEKKKAAKFQEFWGEKAELRRFKDGSILESLVWTPGTGHSIFADIVKHILSRHFSTEILQDAKFIGEEFEKALPMAMTSKKLFEELRDAYNGFERTLRKMEDLPLQVRQVSGISASLRYSSIDPPLFTSGHPLREPAEVLIQFEGSGRWPDDIVAIQRTKAAFLLKIGDLIEDSDASTSTWLGLENKGSHLQNTSFLDIMFDSGATLRLRIHNEREQILLDRQIKDKSTDFQTREIAVAALSSYKAQFTQLPLLTQSITTHCTRFPLLSSTIRLLKKWFNKHMLLSHFSEEFVELLAVHVFLQPYPWQAPSSTMSGFMRTLAFISRWDWRLEPLIVDFTGTMTSEDVSSINTRLEAWRKIDPGMNRTVIFAATNHEITGTAFTDRGPSKMVAARMTALARSACKMAKDVGLALDHKSLFSVSMSDYDFVIHLSPKHVSKNSTGRTKERQYKNLEAQSSASIESLTYQPIQAYIQELKELYDDSIVLFYSLTDGSVIAGLWNPQNAQRAFRVNLSYATKPVLKSIGDQDLIEIDKTAILSEISRIGGDLVTQISTRH
ncbi:nrap protein [Phlyctema vagabunda]|uniref:U3 small nucleolar RNA-associated protein 22 n=1 Tax=Phlyctema vagabunda TaxID=108571 RepID=A0ABR4PS66_9HELO